MLESNEVIILHADPRPITRKPASKIVFYKNERRLILLTCQERNNFITFSIIYKGAPLFACSEEAGFIAVARGKMEDRAGMREE